MLSNTHDRRHHGKAAIARVHVLAASLLAVVLALSWSAAAPLAQSPPAPPSGIKRIPLQKFDVAGTGYETMMGIVVVAPNTSIGRHTHFGVETGYVLEGEAIMTVDGQPPKSVKPGDSYLIPAGVPHDAKSGPKGAKVIATFVVEKGKPFATPTK